MGAAYVFRVTFRLEPEGVSVSPRTFETVLDYPAPTPGEDGWRFFQSHLWRGELENERGLREAFSERLGVPVTAASFSELRTGDAYLESLREAIADDPGAFNAESVDEVLKKYLGSSIRVDRDDSPEQ